MSWKSLLSPISAAVGALFLWARPVFAQTSAQIEEATRRAVTKLDLQTEIPGDPQPSWLHIDLPSINFSDAVLWTALAIVVGIALYVARDDLPRLIFGRSKRWGDAGGIDVGVGAAAPAAEATVTADELAGRGHYREAMHVLLLRAIVEMRDRLGTDFARSLTSREILRRAHLPEAGKISFRDIITRVELSYFGAYPAAVQDYAACRSSFDHFMTQLGNRETRL